MINWVRNIVHNLKTKLKQQTGSAMAMVAWTIAILSILSASMGTLIVNEMIMIIQHSSRTRAYYLAEAGINYAVWELNSGGDGNIGTKDNPVSIPGARGTFYTRYDSGSEVLQAFSTYGEVERQISVKVNSGRNQFTETFETTNYREQNKKTDWHTDWEDGQRDKGELRLSGPGKWNYQWRAAPTQEMYDVFMWDENNGWAVGEYWPTTHWYSEVKRTTNGLTWNKIWNSKDATGESGYVMKSIRFVPNPADPTNPDNAIGWIAGFRETNVSKKTIRTSTVFKTTDGGKTWQRVLYWRPTSGNYENNYPGGAYFEDVFFINDQIGWAAGISWYRTRFGWRVRGLVVRTTNGGQTWTRYSVDGDQVLFSIHFVEDPKNPGNYLGCAVGEQAKRWRPVVYLSSNSGKSWIERRIDIPNRSYTVHRLTDVYLITDKIGWAVGYGERSFDGGASYQDSAIVLKTTDRGKRWTLQDGDLFVGKRGLWSVHFVNEDYGWAVGNDFSRSVLNSDGFVTVTTDGGRNWTSQILPKSANDVDVDNLYSVYFVDENNGWAVGNSAVILRYEPQAPPYYDQGYAYSKPVDTVKKSITSATLVPTLIGELPAGIEIKYYLAVGHDEEGKPYWEEVTPGDEHSFKQPESDLRWKAELSTTDLEVTARIDSITIYYGAGAYQPVYSTWRSN